MRNRALLAALAVVTLLAAPALAQTTPPAAISVTGEASVSVPPDLAIVDGGGESGAGFHETHFSGT